MSSSTEGSLNKVSVDEEKGGDVGRHAPVAVVDANDGVKREGGILGKVRRAEVVQMTILLN